MSEPMLWPKTEPIMTLRDYFAAKAMQGAISCFAFSGELEQFKRTAELAYEQAEAMIAEKRKRASA